MSGNPLRLYCCPACHYGFVNRRDGCCPHCSIRLYHNGEGIPSHDRSGYLLWSGGRWMLVTEWLRSVGVKDAE